MELSPGWPQKFSQVLLSFLFLFLSFFLVFFFLSCFIYIFNTGAGYDFKADVFSFAMLIFEVLSHTEPNAGILLLLFFL